MKKLVLIFLSLILMSACTTSSITKLSETSGSLKFSQAASLDPELVKAINALAFSLQDTTDANEFKSALSIYIALAMTSHGTSGSSYDQFMALLNPQGADEAAWLDSLKALQGNLNAMEKVKIALSNSLWLRDSYAANIKADFLDRNVQYFGAMIAKADFDDPQAADDINAWVNRNTNNLIDKVIDQIDPSTIMFLINTIYFKGTWASQFDKNKTHDGTFHGSSDSTVKFMTQIHGYPYGETQDYQAILLPYEGDQTGMLVVMRKDGSRQITSDDQLKVILDSLTLTSVQLSLPKVDIATKQLLNSKLIGLGLSDPFDDRADFSRMSDDDLFISKVLHKARLLIDEKGTEAAAVTSISVDVTSIPTYDKTMTVDQPFQVFILDLDNQLILFDGYLNDVQASE